MSRYRFVEAERGRDPVTRLCRRAQVSRAAYYQWQEGAARCVRLRTRAVGPPGAAGCSQTPLLQTPVSTKILNSGRSLGLTPLGL